MPTDNTEPAAARPRPRLVAAGATAEEAAAIVAAIERFTRATSPPVQAAPSSLAGWQRAALLEGVRRGTAEDLPDPWINT